MATKKATKRFEFTPEQIQDELTDRIEQGWTNDQIAAQYADTPDRTSAAGSLTAAAS